MNPHASGASALAIDAPSGLHYPETEGIAVERRTIKARHKAFLFLGANDVLLKLSETSAS